MFRHAKTFIVALVLLAPGIAWGACSTPIFPPLTHDRGNWADLENLKVPASLNPAIQRVQTIDGLGHGKINTDFYSVTIDAGGDSAASLAAYLRVNLSTLIFSGTTYRVEPYDARSAHMWKSADPKGAVMTFTLAEIPGVMPLERGSVVVSCISATDFVFSTVETSKDGLHPVAGSRAFGVHDHGNGSLSIFVKAADRVVNAGVFAALPEAGREAVFGAGHDVWVRLLDNIETQFANRRPRDRGEYSVRLNY